MKKNLALIIAAIIIVLLLGIIFIMLPSGTANAPTNTATTTTQTGGQKASLDDLIVVDAPLINAQVSSPLTITGKARGTWYFEASFPIVLTDWDGKIIAEGHAEAQGDWMTTEYVPFKATLTYTTPTPGDPAVNRGTLILKNDNPSGEPSRDKAVEVQVVFK